MRLTFLSLLLAACEPMAATGDPLAPVPPPASSTSTAAPPAAAAPQAAEDAFDFEDDSEELEADPIDDDPIALLAAQQGIEPPPPAPVTDTGLIAEPGGPAAPEAMTMDRTPASTRAPSLRYEPARAVPADWGIRLVSVLTDVQPPRAIFSLPDGSETVVSAGGMLPAQQLVVLAIGDGVVEVARVRPNGFTATIETRMLQSLY